MSLGGFGANIDCDKREQAVIDSFILKLSIPKYTIIGNRVIDGINLGSHLSIF